MKLWTDDYLADTIHLDATESGAYLHLMMAAWRRPDCALPDDDKLLARWAKCDTRQWRRIKTTVMAFWDLGDNQKWTQKRLLMERKSATHKSRTNATAAKSKHLKNNTTTPANASETLCENGAIPIVHSTEGSAEPNGSTGADAPLPASPDALQVEVFEADTEPPDQPSCLLDLSDKDAVKTASYDVAKQIGRRSAPTELMKAGMSWAEIYATLVTAASKVEPSSYLAKRIRDGPEPVKDAAYWERVLQSGEGG